MKIQRSYFILFFLSLLVNGIISLFEPVPGYMDAEYYFAGGLRLSQGYGFSELYIWNYLGGESVLPAINAASLEHPSHTYWMPLASIISALGVIVSGSTGFTAARFPFIFIAALVPPITAGLCEVILKNDERYSKNSSHYALLAGLFAVFPGFYLAYSPTSDTFGIYMLLGGLWLLILGHGEIKSAWRKVILGVVAGLMHLARADGILWLALSLLAVFFPLPTTSSHGSSERSIQFYWTPSIWSKNIFLVLIGYLFIMAPWMARNAVAFGTLLSPGGVRTLWLTGYDELFAYPAELLTASRWLGSGVNAILQARGWSLSQNLQTLLAVQGEIFLLPLIFAGAWRLRRDRRVRFGAFAWLLTLTVMTLVFPFAGARGGFFHSGAALQPLWWVLAPVGLDVFLEQGARLRGWNIRQARVVFSTGLVGLAFFLTFLVAQTRIFGGQIGYPVWNAAHQRYEQFEGFLLDQGAQPGDIVMINNPPGYFLASGRQSIAIPFGDEYTLRQVAARFHVRYLILEIDQVQNSILFLKPADHPGLNHLGSLSGGQFYEFTDNP